MVTYYTLLRDYNIKLDDLTIKEGENILESLVKQYHDAYDVDDVEEMNRLDEEIEETTKTFKRKFVNVDG